VGLPSRGKEVAGPEAILYNELAAIRSNWQSEHARDREMDDESKARSEASIQSLYKLQGV
jgi:hypothetical protein